MPHGNLIYFFQTESTFERNGKKHQQDQEKSWPRWSIHLYVLIYKWFSSIYDFIKYVNYMLMLKLTSFRPHYSCEANIHITTSSSWNNICFVMKYLEIIQSISDFIGVNQLRPQFCFLDIQFEISSFQLTTKIGILMISTCINKFI